MKLLQEYAILVPDVPEGAPQLSVLEYRLATTFGGFTALPGCRGAWVNDAGEVVYDRLTEYRVGVSQAMAAPLVAIKGIALDIGRALRQDAMYIRTPQGALIMPCSASAIDA